MAFEITQAKKHWQHKYNCSIKVLKYSPLIKVVLLWNVKLALAVDWIPSADLMNKRSRLRQRMVKMNT